MDEFNSPDQLKSFLSKIDKWVSNEWKQDVTEGVEDVGRSVKLYNESNGIEVDVFEKQVVGKVRITSKMQERAEEFWGGEQVETELLSNADLFLLKTVAGGDLGAGQRTDIDDLQRTAQAGVEWDVLLDEIKNQRPFNTGSHELQLLRDGSHPLLAIEIAANHIPGLPQDFIEQIGELATEAQLERTILQILNEEIKDVSTVKKRVRSTVSVTDDEDSEVIDEAIERLLCKGILERQGTDLVLLD